MPNKVAQSRIVAVRKTADGTGHLLRIRLRLEAGQADDLGAGWYTAVLPIQNIRPWDAVDEAITPEEIVADESRPFEERMAALQSMRGQQ